MFHKSLNPRLWEGAEMLLDVRIRLLRVALDFLKGLDMPDLRVSDIIVTGSNASFNYNDLSDIDVHLVVDYRRTNCPDLAENLFGAHKNLWNLVHNVSIRGHAVEVYVEDTADPPVANGVYSILRGAWLKEPERIITRIDDRAVAAKAKSLEAQADAITMQSPIDEAGARDFLTRIRRMRQAALAQGGETAVENLAFKQLRNRGVFDRLRKKMISDRDASLSLEAPKNGR